VRAVAAAEYAGGGGRGPAWEALVQTIERAAPGTVELKSSEGAPGFAVRPLERPVGTGYEALLRAAAERVLAEVAQPGASFPAAAPVAPARAGGLWVRVVEAVRRLFSASA